MGKIRDLLDQSENLRLEFYQVGDKVYQVNRIPEDGGNGGKHRLVVHNADGTQDAEKFISQDEYEALKKKSKRVDYNTVGTKK